MEHGASLNGRDAEGKTPLHLAVESGNEDIVTSLLQQNGLDLTARDKAGLTAFASAMNFKNQKAARRILQVRPRLLLYTISVIFRVNISSVILIIFILCKSTPKDLKVA